MIFFFVAEESIFNSDDDVKKKYLKHSTIIDEDQNKNDNLLTNGLDGYNFGLEWGIHHMNLESLDVRESVKFFSEIIGFSEGNSNKEESLSS